jgi:hypothetical protein
MAILKYETYKPRTIESTGALIPHGILYLSTIARRLVPYATLSFSLWRGC